ncbi:MAG: DUF2442 domain-containing protein [Spirulina sp. SIO3F2]|nr:DUF2442 domain-containing protein [Spirulina sp. SIO3F2]
MTHNVNRKWQLDLSEDALTNQIAQARAMAQKLAEEGPCATSVRYDESRGLIEIQLKSGAMLSFPPHLAQELTDATPAQLNDVWLDAAGLSVHWESLDVDFSIAGLMQGLFGTKAWMAELGRKGGQSMSDAKRKAARENGKKGGRPKKLDRV